MRNVSPTNRPWVSALIAAAGVLVAVGSWWGRPAPIENPVLVDGTVVEVLEFRKNRCDGSGTSRRCREETLYQPRIEYRVDGRVYTFLEPGRTSSVPEVGSTVPVEYDASNPADARWTGSSSRWTWMVGLGVGAAMAVSGVVLLVAGRRGAAAPHDYTPGDGVSAAALPLHPSLTGQPAGVPGYTGAAAPPVSANDTYYGTAPGAPPPPGWYRDPDGQGWRWWDGQRWSEHQR